MEDIYTVCSHGGEDSPGIFPRNMYIPCVITGVSFLTRIIPLGNMYTPCVITGARTRRVYAGGEFCSPELFLYGTCTRRMYPICDSL